jgi:hypothetical protein
MGDGGEGKGRGGEGKGERERAGNPQNLYAAYAHGLYYSLLNKLSVTNSSGVDLG